MKRLNQKKYKHWIMKNREFIFIFFTQLDSHCGLLELLPKTLNSCWNVLFSEKASQKRLSNSNDYLRFFFIVYYHGDTSFDGHLNTNTKHTNTQHLCTSFIHHDFKTFFLLTHHQNLQNFKQNFISQKRFD